MIDPVVPADRLKVQENYHKIKLHSAGYRLVYEIDKKEITIYVITVGKRDHLQVYKVAKNRKRT